MKTAILLALALTACGGRSGLPLAGCGIEETYVGNAPRFQCLMVAVESPGVVALDSEPVECGGTAPQCIIADQYESVFYYRPIGTEPLEVFTQRADLGFDGYCPLKCTLPD
jgi:hypothetical protein